MGLAKSKWDKARGKYNWESGQTVNLSAPMGEVARSAVGEIFRRVAFTLAEALITIGIIGVVAALTIPGLINNYKANRLRTQFLKSYSTIQQVFKRIETDDISLDSSSYAGKSFYKIFMNYLNGAADCGSYGENCFGVELRNYYKNLNGSIAFGGSIDDGVILLQDGTVLMFDNYSGADILISADINGYNDGPNKFGYDVFMFQMVDEVLKAMGEKGTNYTNINSYCNVQSQSGYNGISCAYRAKNESDYFKRIVRLVK
ncbi:type II secretion system protein [bacterium]|nr:type II secretion system protein [bacterium]